MGVLTYINNMPLFETISEALNYGTSNNLTGYHTHIYEERNGYMAGTSHSMAVESGVEGEPPTEEPSITVSGGGAATAVVITTTTPTTTTGGGY